MKSTKLKVLARLTDVTLIVVVLICVFISIKPHIDIAKGHIGQQEVTAVRIFDNLFVIDENNNRRYWQDVEDFFFAEDALIIERTKLEATDKVEEITVARKTMIFKTTSDQEVTAVFDFSEFTLIYSDGTESPYYNVKSVGFDKSQRILHILYFNGESWEMRIQNN